MPAHAAQIDLQQLIGEVARRHGIVLHADDAVFAIVTINELVLKSTVREAMKAMTATLDRFDASIERAENRAGEMLGKRVLESADQVGRAVEAQLASREAYGRRASRFWTAKILVCVVTLCAASFWLGYAIALR